MNLFYITIQTFETIVLWWMVIFGWKFKHHMVFVVSR